jgi:alkaline phosphatase
MKLKRFASFPFFFVSLSIVAVSFVQAQPYPDQEAPEGTEYYAPADSFETLPRIPGGQPRNVILMIGDGMGLVQVNAARIKAVGAEGLLYMERMPVVGLIRTHSENSLTTDSAAAGTALAAGVKTHNGKIAMKPGGTRFQSILRAAQELGKSAGMAVTATMSHATPAVFGANVENRSDESLIAVQYIENRINVLFGGGLQFFLPASQPGGARKDDINLLAEAQAAGYQFVQTPEAMREVEGDHVLGLFQLGSLTTKATDEPSLAAMTGKAIELLSRDPEGFFLMVEGSQIDWAGHANNLDNCIRQTLLFDLAVKEALDFAQKSGDTLVIVTADHETGGLALVREGLDGTKLEAQWGTKGHTPIQVPVYAYGPGSERFAGVYDNTLLPIRIAELIGVEEFPRVLKNEVLTSH